jgi:hypothetical protein
MIDQDEDYLPPEAIDVAIEVLSGRTTPAQNQDYEKRWPAAIWRAAIKRVSSSGMNSMLESKNLQLDDGRHNRYGLEPGTIVSFLNHAMQYGEITDRIEAARKVMYRIVNDAGFSGPAMDNQVSALIDANQIMHVETEIPGAFKLWPDVRYFQEIGKTEPIAMLASDTEFLSGPDVEFYDEIEAPSLSVSKRRELVMECVRKAAEASGL